MKDVLMNHYTRRRQKIGSEMDGMRLSGEQSVTRTSELQIYNESRGIISAHFQDERKITREKTNRVEEQESLLHRVLSGRRPQYLQWMIKLETRGARQADRIHVFHKALVVAETP
jgi:hypothetical protein